MCATIPKAAIGRRQVDSLTEYQQRAIRTANPDADLLVMSSLGLSGEVGEYNEIVKKYLFHHRQMKEVDVCLELGDILWYLAIAAHAQGLTLERVAEANIMKLSERHPERWSGDYHAKDNTVPQ